MELELRQIAMITLVACLGKGARDIQGLLKTFFVNIFFLRNFTSVISCQLNVKKPGQRVGGKTNMFIEKIIK